MQIATGRLDRSTVHIDAPPSGRVPDDIATFVEWFNKTEPGEGQPLPVLTRAGPGDHYFESVHLFGDGNGRLGRALARNSWAQTIGHPSLIALAFTIECERTAYSNQLEEHQKTQDVAGSSGLQKPR
ncbi:MAG: Fic family protein [Cypionkella sp.]